MDYKWKGTAELIVGIIIGAAITWGIIEYKYTVYIIFERFTFFGKLITFRR